MNDRTKIEEAVRMILEAVGEKPGREGLVGTPERVARMYEELLAGYEVDPKSLLKAQFNGEHYSQMVILRDIPMQSLCEHHMLPFVGTATVAYIPREKVLGVSKLARLVDCFSKRLQIQERLTQQVATFIYEELEPLGVGVIVKATHECMTIRGVKKPGASMVTSSLLGEFLNPEVRTEFLRLSGVQ